MRKLLLLKAVKYFSKKLHLRCLTNFRIRLCCGENPFVTATISDLTGSFFVDVINPSLSKENGSCYLDKGQSFAGKINVTKSGKTCVHWNEIPYVNNSKFATLEKKTIVGIRKAMVQTVVLYQLNE